MVDTRAGGRKFFLEGPLLMDLMSLGGSGRGGGVGGGRGGVHTKLTLPGQATRELLGPAHMQHASV